MDKKIGMLVIIAFIMQCCTFEKNDLGNNPIGKRAFFNRLLRDPSTKKIPENYKQRNLEFLQSQLTNLKSASSESVGDKYEWIHAGPNNIGGNTKAIAIDSRNPNVIMVGAQSGGLWRSEDKGATWSFKTKAALSMRIKSIGQHTVEKDTWFYTADELFKSTDNGLNWTKVHAKISNNNIENIIVHPSGDLYVYSGGFLFCSKDKGKSFKKVISIISSYTWQIGSSGKIYVLKNEGGGTGGGSVDKGLYVSDNSGANFVKKMDLPQAALDLAYCRFRIAKNKEECIWLIGFNTQEQGLALKIDLKENRVIDKSSQLPDIKTYGDHCFVLEVKPDNPDIFMLGGINLYRITDGMATKVSAEKHVIIGDFPNHHVDQQSFCWDPANSNAGWSGHDGGISYCENLFVTNTDLEWVNKNNKYITTQFYKVAIPAGANDARCTGGTQDNSCPFMRYDNPDFITPRYVGGDGGACHFGKKYLYGSAQQGDLHSSNYNNDGSPGSGIGPFTGVPEGVTNAPFVTEFVVDPGETYMIFMASTQIWRNTELKPDSRNWKHLNKLDFNGSFTTISLSNQDNVLYYAGISNEGKTKVFKLENANVSNNSPKDITPDNLPENVNVSSIGISPVDKNEIILCTSSLNAGVLKHSKDGGKTYQSVLGNLAGSAKVPGPPLISALISHKGDKSRFWVGTSAGLYATAKLQGDNTHWELVAPDHFGLCEIMDLKSRTSDGLIAVATYGRGVVIGKDKEALTNVESIRKNLNMKVYPNPSTTGRFTLICDKMINDYCSVYNMQGQLVLKEKIRGKELIVDLSSCVKGFYILTVNSKKGSYSTKLIKN